jgi:nucleotidyltransferase substrate binding protein (TIGR01987 family)
MSLDLSSLQKSISALSRSIASADTHMASLDQDMQDTVRAGVIQHFKVAYEQCWKMIQHWIKENRTPEDAENPRTRKDLFRLAARLNLIADPMPWFTYGESRNLTSHTYDQEKAISVYEVAMTFIGDAEYLFKQLESMND